MASKKEPKKPSELIQIIDGYAFDYDNMNYTLYEVGQREAVIQRTRIKTGEVKEYADPIGFYSDIKGLCNACLNAATKKAAKQANVKTLGDFIMIMEQIKNEIVSAVQNTSI